MHAASPDEVLRAAASTLGLTDRVLTTAAAYSKACASTGEDADYDAAACVFLSAKMCEEPRRVRDVLNAFELATRGSIVRDAQDYWARKERLVLAEQRLLRALAYETACGDPQVLALNMLRTLGAPRALYEMCVALLNDAGRSCAGMPAHVVAAAALPLGASALELPLPVSWQRTLEVEHDAEAVTAACHALLDAYPSPAWKLQRASRGRGTCAPIVGDDVLPARVAAQYLHERASSAGSPARP